MAKKEDLIGMIFGRLKVIHPAPNKNGRSAWYCVCECGKEIVTYSKTLKNGKTKSCGCLRSEVSKDRMTTHGKKNTKTYKIWSGMKSRCFTKSASGYVNYGGAGVSVCDDWLTFENFYNDMGECPEGHSIDRIDNTKGYSKDNCRWATQLQQNTNQRRSIYINGKTLRAFAEEQGIPYSTAYGRFKRGKYRDMESSST